MRRELQVTNHVAKLGDKTEILYFTAGPKSDQPVVLLHGGGTDHALLSWRETIPALAEAGYRVFAPSYPGYGDSPRNGKPSTMENLIGYLEGLVAFWEVRTVSLVGISMGGALALGYTLAHPDVVNRLILIGSYGLQDYAPYHRMSFFLTRMSWLNNSMWAMLRNSRWAARYTLNAIVRNPASRTESLVDEVLEAMRNTHSQEAFSEFQRDEVRGSGMKTNWSERLPEITIPVLVIHGTHDIGVPLKYAQRAAERLPNARLEIIENAGHWTQRDYPGKVNKLILDFLQA